MSSPGCQHLSGITGKRKVWLGAPSFRAISSCLGEILGRLCVSITYDPSEKSLPLRVSLLLVTFPIRPASPWQSICLLELAWAAEKCSSLSCFGKASLNTGPEKKIQSPDTTRLPLPGIRGTQTNSGMRGPAREWQLKVTQHPEIRAPSQF